jgi:hypothetical protein
MANRTIPLRNAQTARRKTARKASRRPRAAKGLLPWATTAGQLRDTLRACRWTLARVWTVGQRSADGPSQTTWLTVVNAVACKIAVPALHGLRKKRRDASASELVRQRRRMGAVPDVAQLKAYGLQRTRPPPSSLFISHQPALPTGKALGSVS